MHITDRTIQKPFLHHQHHINGGSTTITLDSDPRTSEGSETPARNPRLESLSIAMVSDSHSFPLVGDYIGCESCVDMVPPSNGVEDTVPEVNDQWRRIVDKRRRTMTEKEYPPPIPLLARTENLHSRMPWVLRRHYTSDGRLILREERVRHYEYFRAHRSGGRLTLQLVPLDDDGFDLPIADPDDNELSSNGNLLTKEEDVKEDEDNCSRDNDCGDGDDDDDCNEEGDSVLNEECSPSESGGNRPGEWKCLYSTVSPRSSCIFGVAVPPALGPVLG